MKQIVGKTLKDGGAEPTTHFVSPRSAGDYARLYRRDGLRGGHVIQLGPGNRDAAMEALRAYPGGLQVGGGMDPRNAPEYLNAGASQVIVTSFLFDEGTFSAARLRDMEKAVGKQRLVLDLSCRRQGDRWQVACDRWQTLTDLEIDTAVLDDLAEHCAEFLVHAADAEGLCSGIDEALVTLLGRWGRAPVTYAGGARSVDDLSRVADLSRDRVDLAIGSALDLFGGSLIRYRDCVDFNASR